MNMAPWNPKTSKNDGKNLIAMKEKTNKQIIQNDTALSLIFSGIISGRIVSGSERIPNDETNIMKEKIVTGIQLTVSTFTFHDFNII